MIVRYPLCTRGRTGSRMSLDRFARAADLHPEMVRRFVALGLLDPVRDDAGNLWFRPGDLATAGRIQRLHASLSINYAGIGLVLDLLDRIRRLEATRNRPQRRNASSWT